MKGLITLNSKKLNLKILITIKPYYMYTLMDLRNNV